MKRGFALLLVSVLLPGAGLAAEQAHVFSAPIYVTVEGGNAVDVLPQQTVWSGLNSAHFDALSPDGSRLLVSSHNTGKIHLVDTATGKKMATFDISSVGQGVKIGPHRHWDLASAPKQGAVAVINGTSKVAVIDMRSLEVVRQIPTQGAVPFWIAVQGNP